MSLIDNEQAKLTATYFNGLAIAVAAVGGIGPWAAFVIQAPAPGLLSVVTSSVLCLCTSAGVHMVARNVLTRLREA
jgi:hypothetical protein